MIIYSKSKIDFQNDVVRNLVVEEIKNNFLNNKVPFSQQEVLSWHNSIRIIKDAIELAKIKDDAWVSIEFQIPYTKKRIDFLIFGHRELDNEPNTIIIELKQWSKADSTGMPDIVRTRFKNGEQEVTHPSYQAYTYLKLINDYMEGSEALNLNSLVYMHNASRSNNLQILDNNQYHYIKQAPIYFQEDVEKLADFINLHTAGGNGHELYEIIKNGKIRPSKKLIDVVSSMLEGNEEFFLIEKQKQVYEKILYDVKQNEDKKVFIINGNPGTGKSVVAINLLASFNKMARATFFVAPTAAFRDVIKAKIIKNVQKENVVSVKNLFKSSGSFYELKSNEIDTVIVDEAHRLKNGSAYMYKGENQIEDVINASKNSIFFVDERQQIRNEDIGSNSNIVEAAKKYGARVFNGENYILETQFRCSGGDGYINWVDNALQVNETANYTFEGYDFEIVDNPNFLIDHMKKQVENKKTARIIAGYAWSWDAKKLSKEHLLIPDVKIPEFQFAMPWNSPNQTTLWAIENWGQNQIGCIHSVQGIEFDWCYVIIGKDLTVIDGEIIAVWDEYKDQNGKKGLKNNSKKLTEHVKNIYRVLLTRGALGTKVYIYDDKLKSHFKSWLSKNNTK